MSIPVATTRITVQRSDQDGTIDDYTGVTYSTWKTGVRAVIGSHRGVETNAGGTSSQVQARLDCDPIGLRHDDRVLDETTGETWHVVWCQTREGLLAHTVADLVLVTDRAGVV